MQSEEITLDEQEWLMDEFGSLTDELLERSPSEWAEEERYLPRSVTPYPGPFAYDVNPFMVEIVDNFDIRSPVREVAVMKGVQITATVAVLEVIVGYIMGQIKSAPAALVTADKQMAELRMNSYVMPMIDQSGLTHLIRSADPLSTNKKGATSTKLEWEGGGFLLPLGAKSAPKFRSFSAQYMLRDEIDGWPWSLGNDGCPIALSGSRTDAYNESRKILDLSTPTIKGQSKIEQRYELGDKRHYQVACLKCEQYQAFKFERRNKETGEITGIMWELDEDGILIPDSVVYTCKFCSHPHKNADKHVLYRTAKWVPTAKAKVEGMRSYHISALYSPVGFFPWSAAVNLWLQAWDTEHNKPKDMEKLQTFYNNVLGMPFEKRGSKIKFSTVSEHRRRHYHYGEVNNTFAVDYCGGIIGALICTVDVHPKNIAVMVTGWSRTTRAHVIDYWTFEGNPLDPEDAPTWGRLQELILDKKYIADDGRVYPIALTLVDSGFETELVYEFCAQFELGVYPIKGRPMPTKSAQFKEFSEFKSTLGTVAFHVVVDYYKDRWNGALRRSWDGVKQQPQNFFNAPQDCTDKQLKELTVENRITKIDKTTGKDIGFEWFRPQKARNEMWDLLVYANLGIDIIAYDIFIKQMKLDAVNMPEFWDMLENEETFHTLPQ